MRRLPPAYFHLAAFLLLAFFLWETGEIGKHSSATADEPIYIRSGLLILEEGCLELNDISSPFLIKALNAWPVRGLAGASAAAHAAEPGPEAADWSPLLRQWRAGVEMLRRLGPRIVLPIARLVPRLTGVALGLLLYLAGLALLGGAGALCALAVYVLLPEVAAHASLATLEAGCAFCCFAALLLLERFLRTARLRWALGLGLALGAALLAKTTGIVLALFIACAVGLRWARDRRRAWPLGLLACALAAWIVLNAAFSFKGTFDRPADRPEYPVVAARLAALPAPLAGTAKWAAEHLPFLLPRSYVHTLVTQAGIAGKGKRLFFHGRYTTRGWWWLMAVTFLVKMPLAFLLLLPLGLLFPGRDGRRPVHPVHPAFLFFLLVFFAFSNRTNFGVRYLYPALPSLALFAGGTLALLFKGRRIARCCGAALLLWLAWADLSVHPHQLSYANEAAGGPENLYRVLADSNVDWGQDLPALADLMKREEISRVKLSYFGSDDPGAYGIAYDYLPSVGLNPPPGRPWWFEARAEESFTLEPGVYALSANNLQGLFFRNRDLFADFRVRTPDFRAGYSILVYDLRE